MINLIDSKEKLDIILQDKAGIIFDMDGTILDSMGMWNTFCTTYLLSKGKTPADDVDKKVKTMTIPLAATFLRESYDLPYTDEEIIGQVYEMTGELYKNELVLKSKAMDFIKYLDSNNKKMIIATATEYDLAYAAMSRNKAMPYMKDIITCSMAGASKHEPDIYIQACDILKLDIKDCIICEDSLFAAKTAKNAGFNVLGVYDDAEMENWVQICDITDYQVVLD